MAIPYEKRLKNCEDALIQAVLLHGQFKAMRIFGLKDYGAFSRWWEKRKMKRSAKSEEVEKAKGWPIFTELAYDVKKGGKWPRFTELAYIAGIFDATVGFGIGRSSHIPQGYSYSLFFACTNMNHDIVSYLSKTFGGAVIQIRYPSYYEHEIWQWSLSARDAYFALNIVYPYLRIKKEIARMCIDFCESYYGTDVLNGKRKRRYEPTARTLAEADKLYSEYIDYRRKYPGGFKSKMSKLINSE